MYLTCLISDVRCLLPVLSIVCSLSCASREPDDEDIITKRLLVYDEMTDKPVPGARVAIYRTLNSEPFAESISDKNGRVEFKLSYGQVKANRHLTQYLVASAQEYTTSVVKCSPLDQGGPKALPIIKVQYEGPPSTTTR